MRHQNYFYYGSQKFTHLTGSRSLHVFWETNREQAGHGRVSENDEGSLEQLLLYADEHYPAGKIAPGRPFRKDPTWDRRISA
ncbi:hypothetical protein TNCV_2965801 [Trichonephila clavipes]|nr:hypothetical protein TNCV_2965801 [Trichonephila clavipes]